MWQANQIAMILASSAPQLTRFMPIQPTVVWDAHSSDTDDEDDEQKRTLFCANLDERVTEELLYEVFLQAGPIESVRIPKDNSGKQRSFGFVTYVHKCTPPYAMRLFAGLTLFRKPIAIKYQGESSQSPLSSSRRSLPFDCERYQSRERSSSNNSYDNALLRHGSFPAFYDTSLNDSATASNPFRSRSSETSPFKPTSPDNWTKGSAARHGEKNCIAKHASSNTRPHDSMGPYQRTESYRRGGSDARERDRRHEPYDDYQRRNYHNGSDRRSEQRNSNRR